MNRGFYQLSFLFQCTVALLAFPGFAFCQTRTKPLEYRNQYLKPIQQTLEIDGVLLGQCFFLKASEFSSIRLDSIQEKYPELFSYLIGSTRIDYSTGNEGSLRRMILESPDHSVDPVQLFTWSLALNQGDLFGSILTIHELLRNEARFYRKWVNYDSNFEKMSAFFNKFIDIRGDLEERGDSFHGDHRGSWYRIWGAMLDYLSMVAPEKALCGNADEVCSKTEGNTLADIYGAMTSIMAELAKPVIMYGIEGDERKSEINQKGYDAISSMLKSPETLGQKGINPDLARKCTARKYLVPKEK